MKYFFFLISVLLLGNCSRPKLVMDTAKPGDYSIRMAEDTLLCKDVVFESFNDVIINEHLSSWEMAEEKGFTRPTDLLKNYISVNSQDWMNQLYLNEEEAPQFDYDFLTTRRKFIKLELLSALHLTYGGEEFHFFKTNYYAGTIIPVGIKIFKIKKIKNRLYFIEEVEPIPLEHIAFWFTNIKNDIAELCLFPPELVEARMDTARPAVKKTLFFSRVEKDFNIYRFGNMGWQLLNANEGKEIYNEKK